MVLISYFVFLVPLSFIGGLLFGLAAPGTLDIGSGVGIACYGGSSFWNFRAAGVGIHLLYRNRFRDCAIATAIALLIGALYVWPLRHYHGNRFVNVSAYQKNDWHGGLPFNFPLVAIVRNTIPINAPLTNLALTWGGFRQAAGILLRHFH
jgi:hypothetical protein